MQNFPEFADLNSSGSAQPMLEEARAEIQLEKRKCLVVAIHSRQDLNMKCKLLQNGVGKNANYLMIKSAAIHQDLRNKPRFGANPQNT